MKRERNSLFAVPVAHAGLEHVPSVEDSFLDRSLSKLVKVIYLKGRLRFTFRIKTFLLMIKRSCSPII